MSGQTLVLVVSPPEVTEVAELPLVLAEQARQPVESFAHFAEVSLMRLIGVSIYLPSYLVFNLFAQRKRVTLSVLD